MIGSPFSEQQVIFLLLELVQKTRLGFRTTANVVGRLAQAALVNWAPVSAGAIRQWLIRLGVGLLQLAPVQANDWILLTDHTLQMGPEKCLLVLGIRAVDLPSGRALQREDLTPLGLFVEPRTNKQVVREQLTVVEEKLGSAPLAILSDQGSDLAGGIAEFCESRATIASSDIAHKVGNLLKAALTKTETESWNQYNQTVSRLASRVRLTAAAFLVPPSQRSKARFMNLSAQLKWARNMLNLLDNPSVVEKFLSRELLEEKYGALRKHAESIEKWSRMQEMGERVIQVVATHGYGRSTPPLACQAVSDLVDESTAGLGTELLNFVSAQCQAVPAGLRVAGSTQVLESSFGCYKATAGEHQKGGFTSLLPALGAMVGRLGGEQVSELLLKTPWKKAQAFVKDLLGTTFSSKRCQTQAELGAQKTM